MQLFLLFVLLSALLMLLFSGNSRNVSIDTDETSMFVVIEISSAWYIICHRDTRVMYMYTTRGVLEPLVNPDGTPMVYKG